VLLAAFLLIQTVNSIKEFNYIGADVPPVKSITVSGKGEIFAVPDIATFSFAVIEERESASAAQEAAAEASNRIIAFIKEQGIEEKDIKTTSFNLSPRYEFGREVCPVGFSCPSGERELVGFEVSQTVQVKVRTTSQAGDLIAGVSELGASNVSGLSFTIDDEVALKAQAREQAITDAKTKADALADALDVRLVRIVGYYENDEPYYPIYAESRALGLGGADAGVSLSAPELPTGENQIVSQVNITYEIR
jgi:hypothetical protein